MGVVHDARDVLIGHFESRQGIGPPFVPVLPHHDDRQLAVHFCHCEAPRHSLPVVISEVWRFAERPGKAIYNAQLSVRANQFSESVPITLIESIDVEMQKPRQLCVHFAVRLDRLRRGCQFRSAPFSAALTPPTVEPTSSAISSRV